MPRELYHRTPYYQKKRARKRAERDARRWAEDARIVAQVFHGDLTIRSGPFRGMEYVKTACGSHLLPKLLGSYEEPIHPWLAQCARHYETLINIGCAEGYYAVGFTWAGFVSHVYAFDIDRRALEVATTLAEKNRQSDRVIFGARCGHDELEALTTDRTLILCDIEGAEVELLDPSRCPALRRVDIIFEAHDVLIPYASLKVIQRFLSTHRVSVVYDYPRDPGRYEFLSGLSHDLAAHILDEKRPAGMSWVRMIALERAKEERETLSGSSLIASETRWKKAS
ncbi:MAG: hypothetical protein GXP27_09880 [Planctomycetes bacterium]|nr:hypothetical protein [Planctomycetota bacterium]